MLFKNSSLLQATDKGREAPFFALDVLFTSPFEIKNTRDFAGWQSLLYR